MSDIDRLGHVADISRLHGRERPDAVALDFQDRLTTYGELDERASRVANGLIGLGQQPGARIGYIGRNCDRFWEVVLGAFKSRTATVTVNWRLAPPEMLFILDDCDCEVLFVGGDFYGVVEELRLSLPRLSTIVAMDGGHPEWPSYEAWRDAQDAADPALPNAPDDDIFQLYTSGTTGLPKGVCLTSANYLSLFQNPPVDVPAYTHDDVVLIAMPFFHVAGINMGMNTLAHGAGGVVLADVDVGEVLRLIPEKQISQALLVPAVILALTQHPKAADTDFSPLKRMAYGGSPIPEAVLSRAIELMGCDFMQAYGLTETTGGPCTYLPPADHAPGRGKLRSCGVPAPGREVRVVDGEGRTLPPGEVGEIVVRAACIMRGYWKRPEATAEAIRDGWFHTGDAGYFDGEGYLYIHDRVKEMIVSGGENTYPAEVENALAAHPDILDAAVIGVPDEKWGEAVKAIVVARPGAGLEAAGIIAFARRRIAGYKLPKSVDFVETIPRNPSGKILRRDLRKPYWEGRERQVN
ncbi:MAG TPA: long-chain-fatty-acid--CoA ligase [Phenylobacterium sp.]|nr:long-chain-fatty-acid--CoA ligase [Phenylobacterium sp.]